MQSKGFRMNPVSTSIRLFPGVGQKRAEAYERLGIRTAGDLLRHFPRAYQHRGSIKPLSAAQDGEICALLLTVGTQPRTALLKNRMTVTKFSAFDDSASCTVVFFNQNYIRDVFRVGMTFRFWAKVSVKGSRYELTSPQFEAALPGKPLPEFTPIYPLTAGLSQKLLSNACGIALTYAFEAPCPEILPAAFREAHSLPAFAEACRMIHRPQSEEEIALGRSYFIYEELYLFSLGIAANRKQLRRGRAPGMSVDSLSGFFRLLPFDLTGAQKRCMEEIRSDMAKCIPMSRLVSGDVGSGKTVVAAAAVYICLKNGYQAMLMAPTEILANQHYQELSALFSALEFRVGLLTGSLSASRKRAVRTALADGTLDLVIGTHALLSSGVHAKKPGLVITDEQHRFGVFQRAALAARSDECADGSEPHVMVMSATPIPRTLSLILYGDLSVSAVDELPPGRQRVDTYVVNESYRQRLNTFIRKQVSSGGQVYIVCPAVESSEEDASGDELDCGFELVGFFGKDAPEPTDAQSVRRTLKSAVSYCAELQEIFPDIPIAFLHGKMKPAEKDAVMCAFAAGNIRILVSTTVIEVGVNVPNACLMIVENAERFGLSQLHQLRGRVGRGTRKSYCVLVSDTKSENAKKRLQTMCSSYNGYEIAQRDLELRGPGDFFPSQEGQARQSGEFNLGIASLCHDMEQLKAAAEAAADTVSSDPELEKPEHQAAREAMEKLFSLNSHTVN